MHQLSVYLNWIFHLEPYFLVIGAEQARALIEPRLVGDEKVRPASAGLIDLARALKFGRKRLDLVHFYPFGHEDNYKKRQTSYSAGTYSQI